MSERAEEKRRTRHHPYVCEGCGREVRVAAQLEPDDHGSEKNTGFIHACFCTKHDGPIWERPESWVVDLDTEVLENE